MKMKMTDKNVEIRQLIPGQISDLARILDEHHGWKKLMSCITNDNFSENENKNYKYTTEDIRLVEQAGEQYSCTEILMSEWGTSGKERPTVRTLHKFLLKAQLIRAADYVSEKILKEPPSENPAETTISEILNPETIVSHASISKQPTVECDNFGKTTDVSMQFTVEANNSVEEQFSQEEIENLNLINFDAIKTCTNNFDPSTILGSGGFGTVYFGQLGDKNVAIKKLNIFDRDSHLLKQFKNELIMLTQCNSHPNILPLVAVSLNQIPCLIYEYMPNGSLDKRLTCKLKEFPAMSWQKRVFIASDISNGLKYLHTALEVPFIHRDIKSANILLDSEDIAKIGDFGLVRKHNSFKTSNTMVFQGTQAYTAPEAFHGTISVKIDIFSFGVVLLELLTGLPAYNPDREGGESLLDYVEEVAVESTDFNNLLDKRAGSWDIDIWTEIYDLYKKCTAYKKIDRPDILEVDSTMAQLKEKVSKTIVESLPDWKISAEKLKDKMKTVYKKKMPKYKESIIAGSTSTFSALDYPKNADALRKIESLWNDYYKCLESKYNISEKKTISLYAVAAFANTFVQLDCNVCVSPDDMLEEVKWYFADQPYASDEVVVGENENQHISAFSFTLLLSYLQLNQQGMYFCRLKNDADVPHFVHVLGLDEPIREVKQTDAKTDPFPQKPVKIKNTEISIWNDWTAWTKCNTCGKTGKRTRIGYCYVGLVQNLSNEIKANLVPSKEQLKISAEALQETVRLMKHFTYGIPCRSDLLPADFKNDPMIKNFSTEIMTELCKVSCQSNVIFEVVDKSGNVVDAVNNSAGIYSVYQEIPHQLQTFIHEIQYVKLGEPYCLSCPKNSYLHKDAPVQWVVEGQLWIKEIVEEASNERILLNYLDEIIFVSVEEIDLNKNYSMCVNRGKAKAGEYIPLKKLSIEESITKVINGLYLDKYWDAGLKKRELETDNTDETL